MDVSKGDSFKRKLAEKFVALRPNLWLYGFACAKIPMILWLTPKILELDDQSCTLVMPLSARSKNHLGSLYFGAFCVGADLACGLLAMQHIRAVKKSSQVSISLIFKDFQAKFLKRAESQTYFICSQGDKIQSCVNNALISGTRCEQAIRVDAVTGDDIQVPVASFVLTLSLKRVS